MVLDESTLEGQAQRALDGKDQDPERRELHQTARRRREAELAFEEPMQSRNASLQK